VKSFLREHPETLSEIEIKLRQLQDPNLATETVAEPDEKKQK
jgi:hypothetical protein